MSAISIVCIAWGVLVIATRGPLLVAPEATLRVYQKSIETPARIRGMACPLALGAWLTLDAAGGSSGTLSNVFGVFGWWAAGASAFLLLLPKVYQQFARVILEAFDPTALRVLGAASLGIGGLLVYVGVVAT